MNNKIFDPKNPEIQAKYNLGDIVVLKSFLTHCLNIDNKYYFRDTAPINISPFMVIIRADRNEINYITDDRRPPDFVRYRCMWYDPNKGDFQEEIFFESLLFRIEASNNNHLHLTQDKPLFGKTSLFRTREFEMKKVYPITNPYNRVHKVINFIPPDLIISGVKTVPDTKEENNEVVYQNKNGETIRYDSHKRITCQWYSTSQGKFMKKDFIPHALILNPMEINSTFTEG